MSGQLTHEDCLDYRPDRPGECRGQVEFRLAPDRDDFKAFPRCDAHWERRLDSATSTMELLSDLPAPWFDPAYAGEQWDES